MSHFDDPKFSQFFPANDGVKLEQVGEHNRMGTMSAETSEEQIAQIDSAKVRFANVPSTSILAYSLILMQRELTPEGRCQVKIEIGGTLEEKLAMYETLGESLTEHILAEHPNSEISRQLRASQNAKEIVDRIFADNKSDKGGKDET